MTTTNEESALLAAIAAQHEDDTVRLVYADWLDEQGRHARAELIRLQCRIAERQRDGHGCDDRQCPAIEFGRKNPSPGAQVMPTCEKCIDVQGWQHRESQLLAAHQDEWLSRPCPECGGGGVFHYPAVKRTNVCEDCNGTGDAGGLYERVQWPNALTVARRPVVWARGFPHAVECSRLEDVLRPSAAAFGDADPVFWKPSPWALAVATHHPTVRDFRCRGREPYSMYPDSWRWFVRLENVEQDADRSILPEPVYRATVYDENGGERYWRTRERALSALWRALGRLVHAAVKR